MKRRDVFFFFRWEGKREFRFWVVVDLLLIVIFCWLILYKYCTSKIIISKLSLSLSIIALTNCDFFSFLLFYVLEKGKNGKKMKERRKKFL